MDLYAILRSAHSGWRYLVLILLVLATLQALAGWMGKKSYTEGNRKLNVFTLISAHVQVLLGLVIYFVGEWYKTDSSTALGRYWKMEHVSLMVIAVVLITIGNAKSKKIEAAAAKHKTIAIFFGIALLLIVGSIFMMTKTDPSRTFFGSYKPA